MKKLLILVLFSVLSLTACKKDKEPSDVAAQAQQEQAPVDPATLAEPKPVPQPSTPEELAQAAPPLHPQSDDPVCVEANYVRMNVCNKQPVDCRTIMQSAKPELVEKIKGCEPGPGPETFSGEQVVGGIPCCVPMGPIYSETPGAP
ncbi:MAG TPA: hypothetical protein VIN59_01690 [Alphaproteobacteria bacterium]